MPVQSAPAASPPARAVRQTTELPRDLRPSSDDLELRLVVAAAATGDAEAWQHLSQRFGPMITGIARSCRLGDVDAGEVFQTAWLRLVENIDRIEQPERVGAWLATTARRESLRLFRARSRIEFDSESLTSLPDVDQPAVDAAMLTDERAVMLRIAYDRLPPRCQRLLGLLSDDDAPSYKEISEVLSMPIGSIGPTRGRCLDHLRRLLLEVCDEL